MKLEPSISSRKIKEIMSQDLVLVAPGDPLMVAWQKMHDNDIKHLVVVEKEKLCGVLSDRDILCELSFHENIGHLKPHTCEYAMNPNVQSAGENEPLSNVVKKMLEHKIHSVVVVDSDNVPVGIITDFDLLSVLEWALDAPRQEIIDAEAEVRA